MSSGVNVADIKSYIASLYGKLNDDEGVLFGSPDAKVRRIQVCWMADVLAIENAVAVGADLIVAHEALVYPYNTLATGGNLEFMSWRTNKNRIDLLAKSGISVIRAHMRIDRLCIYNDFASVLGLNNPIEYSNQWMVKVFDVPPVSYGEMIKRVKAALSMKLVRATNGKDDRMIKRIGLTWGGLGLSTNVGYANKLVEKGCDLFIAGETDNYGIRFAVDAGIDVIETSHELSENFGLRRFTGILGETFPNILMSFFENRPLWDLK